MLFVVVVAYKGVREGDLAVGEVVVLVLISLW